MGDPDGVLSSWLLLGPALTVPALWGSDPENGKISLHQPQSFYYSAFQINKHLKKNQLVMVLVSSVLKGWSEEKENRGQSNRTPCLRNTLQASVV